MKRLESLSGMMDLPFPQYDMPPATPYEILLSWLEQAHQENVREPDAWTLATRDDSGSISMRTIFPVHLDGEKLWFATHIGSRKSKDICANREASCHIYWRELGRQISLSGNAELLPDYLADKIWHKRNSAYDPVSIASHQSEPLTNINALLAAVAQLENDGKLPRPERFVVWQLTFNSYEFWSASASRIHKRLIYTRNEQGWENARLQP
ncbi:pyridoxal 5'-phosphate synthase [Pantoea sp. FN0307]|uniref:pyridoxal 5'-phosphate synthase n=1 Tax=Pantoea sp. FN0307 TaxID=3418560 RepID=UPI003CF1FEB9